MGWRAAVGTRAHRPAAGPRGGWRRLGATRAPRGRRAGTPGPEAGPRGSAAGTNGRQPPSSWPTEKALRGARERWCSPRGPEAGRGASVARPWALFPGTGVQGGVGAVGSGGKWPVGRPARRRVPIRSTPGFSLGGGGLRNSPARWGRGWRDVEGLPVASEKTRSRGSLSTRAEFKEPGTWKKSRRRTPRHRFGRVLHPSVCFKSDTKHESKDSTAYRLLETFIYVSPLLSAVTSV